MFGKRLRELFGSTPVGPVLARPERRKTDNATSDTSEIEVTIIESADDDGFDQLADMPTSEVKKTRGLDAQPFAISSTLR